MLLKNILRRIGADTAGATAVEYGLIVSLVVIACIGAFHAVAGESIEMWDNISAKASEVMG